jgi:hypothetical protein
MNYIKRDLHIFNYNLQLDFNCKWHLQWKWLIVAFDKLHKTLAANIDVMMIINPNFQYVESNQLLLTSNWLGNMIWKLSLVIIG